MVINAGSARAAFVGLAPQHLKYDGAITRAIIGDDVIIQATGEILPKQQ